MRCIVFFITLNILMISEAFSQNISEKISLPTYTAEIEVLEEYKKYCLCIRNNSGVPVMKSEIFSSTTGAELEWLGESCIAVYGGSSYAPDCFCIIYDGDTNRLTQKIYRPVCIDIKTETVVSVETDKIIVMKMFDEKSQTVIVAPDDMASVIDYWNGIRRGSTKIIDGILYICYITDYDIKGAYISEKIKAVPLSNETENFLFKKENMSEISVESKNYFKHLKYLALFVLLSSCVIIYIVFSQAKDRKTLK